MAVNAPEAGTVTEYLANEEDTVTVGQDLLKLELGGSPKTEDKQEGGQDPKAPAADDQPTSSHPKSKKNEVAAGESPSPPSSSSSTSPKKEPEPSKQEPKQSAAKKDLSGRDQLSTKSGEQKKLESKGPDAKAITSGGPYGNREERRVCPLTPTNS